MVRRLIGPDGLGPGDRVPSEEELATKLNVGRTTVREGLKLLEREGVIEVSRGSGRYVSQRPLLKRPLTSWESVSNMVVTSGWDMTSRVLRVERAEATAEESEALELPGGEEVVRLFRLRLGDGDPLIYSVDVIPATVFEQDVDEIDWSGSLIDLLDEAGYRIKYAVSTIEAAKLPGDLKLEHDELRQDPWLLMKQVNRTRDGLAVVYSYDYHRGSRFQFEVLRTRDDG